MKRVCVLCVALFVLVMALPALATETRVMTMGDQHLFIQDDYNIWNFSSTVNNYPRHLIVDHNGSFGGVDRVGMVVPFLKGSVLGAFFSNEAYAFTYAPILAGQRADLFYGYRAANFDLGAHIDWWGNKQEAGANEQSASAIGIQAGIGINANGNMLEADLFYKKLAYTDQAGTVVDSADNDDGSSLVGVNARYLLAYNNMVTLVPAISFSQWKEANLAGEEEKTTMIDLGVGCNTVPLQGTEFLTSIGIDMYKFEETDGGATITDEKQNILPYVKFGADIQVKQWLFFRVGAQKWIQTIQEDKSDPANVLKDNFPVFDYHIGAGIMLGDVQFDCEVSKFWLHQGPYLLSGSPGPPMFPRISFKYDFR